MNAQDQHAVQQKEKNILTLQHFRLKKLQAMKQ